MKANEINIGDVGEFGFSRSMDYFPAVVVDRTGSNLAVRYIDNDNRWGLAIVDADTLMSTDGQEFTPDIPEIYVTAADCDGVSNSSRVLGEAMTIGIDYSVAHISSFTVAEGK